MEPIIINTELNFSEYYNVNMYIMLRKKVIWILVGLSILMFVIAIIFKDPDHTFTFLGIFYFLFALCIPFFVYLSSKRMFKKVPQMKEPKVFEITSDYIKLTGASVKMETTWANIDKVIKRKNSFIVFSANSRNFFNFPFLRFVNDSDIIRFESIVKQNVAKTNF